MQQSGRGYLHSTFLIICIKVRAAPCFHVPNNVEKQKARPKRSITEPDDDHTEGLWVNYDFLRRHQAHRSEVIFHPPEIGVNNRYLELADIALGTKKEKKKSKSAN